MTKWPIVEILKINEKRFVKLEYITRITEHIMDAEKCILCGQCVKVCPKQALERAPIKKGVKQSRYERMPYFKDPKKCVFCGICMIFCPSNAISMRLDGNLLSTEDLPIMKKNIIPKLVEVKPGKITPENPEFSSDLWNKIINSISLKK